MASIWLNSDSRYSIWVREQERDERARERERGRESDKEIERKRERAFDSENLMIEKKNDECLIGFN